MLCFTCIYGHVVSANCKRSASDSTDLQTVKVCQCVKNPEAFTSMQRKLPTNHSLVTIEGYPDVVECSFYDKRTLSNYKVTPVDPEVLGAKIGNMYINSEEMPVSSQWERIYTLLNQQGFSIVRKE